jgi:metal-responsive CopG/Arc/MetJ family transcriptional regulator
MRNTITISLPSDVRKRLDRSARNDGVSRSDVVRESLRDYLFIREFRGLRKRMLRQAAAKGIFTDDDVFKHVS